MPGQGPRIKSIARGPIAARRDDTTGLNCDLTSTGVSKGQ